MKTKIPHEKKKKRFPKPDDFTPDPVFPKGHTWAGQKRCQAWNSNHGRQCFKKPMKGMNVCGRCGGKSLKGIDSPKLKTGKHSKYLQNGLLEKYQHQLIDPDRLSLLDDIALFDARIAQLLEFISTGQGLEIWARLTKLWSDFEKANARKDFDRLSDLAIEIGETIEQGTAVWQSWDQIDKVTERKRRMIDSEVNRQAKAKQVYQINEVVLLLTVLLEAANNIVSNQQEKRALNAEFSNILGSFN